jgi:hypothetical protein
MTNSEINRAAFRCTVLPEQSAASLRVGMSRRRVRVTDTSRDAFTLDVDYATFRRLKEGCRATLEFQGETWEVECTATFQLIDEQYHVSMARIRDRTRVRGPKTTFWSLLPTTNAASSPALPLALLLSFFFACVALPGMGDSLGTAPKIRKVVQDIWHRATGS